MRRRTVKHKPRVKSRTLKSRRYKLKQKGGR